MNFHNITKDDMVNGEGLRTVLWVSGCSHHCPNCQNPITWDPNSGVPFDLETKNELFGYLDEDYCSGLTLSGGDPLYSENRSEILDLLKEFRIRYGFTSNKTVWLYTGYSMDEIHTLSLGPCILSLIDVLVDGEYKEELRDTSRLWVGSDNQIIWRRNGLYWTPDPKEYQRTLNDEQHEKEKGCC